MSNNISDLVMSTDNTTPTLVELPYELKEIIFGYVLEKECPSRICLPYESTYVRISCRRYSPSLLFVNREISSDFKSFFYRKIVFVIVCVHTIFGRVFLEEHANALRNFVNIEVKMTPDALVRTLGIRGIRDLQLHKDNVTTLVLRTDLLWASIHFHNHMKIIALLQDWQSTWQRSVITIAPLDDLCRNAVKMAVTYKKECLLNQPDVRRAWWQAFGPGMIVNKIVDEFCPRRD